MSTITKTISAKVSIVNSNNTPDPTRTEDLSISKLNPNSEYSKIAEQLITELTQCRLGKEGWRDFEKICKKIILFVFEPCFAPFGNIEEQSYSLSGIDRIDYRIPNNTRNDRTSTFWQEVKQLHYCHNIVVECKNLTNFLQKDEIQQTAGYSWHTNGTFRIIFSRKGVNEHGLIILRNYFITSEKKLILVFSQDDLVELIKTRTNSTEPEDILCRLRSRIFRGI